MCMSLVCVVYQFICKFVVMKENITDLLLNYIIISITDSNCCLQQQYENQNTY